VRKRPRFSTAYTSKFCAGSRSAKNRLDRAVSERFL
jgi:hypothetical protein